MPLQAVRLLLAIAALAGLGACAADSTPSPAPQPPHLEGTAWLWIAPAGLAVSGGAPATLQIAEGRAQGSDGCNRYAMPLQTAGGRFALGAPGVGTRRACPPDVARAAEAFQSALQRARAWRLQDGRLQLLDGEGRLLVQLAAQATGLAGTAWQVTAYNNGRQAVVSVLPGAPLTVVFGADAQVAGSAGCNRYSGGWSGGGEGLRIGPLRATRMACPQPDGLMAQEAALLRALESATRARREGDRLELRTAEGALAADLRLLPAGAP